MRKRIYKTLLYAAFAIAVAFTAVNAVRADTGYVDPTDKWAWGTNIGWVNFNSTHGGVTVYDDHLEGYAWAENVGWIRLGTYEGGGAHTYANDAAGTYGVNNDGAGNLSGYAWGTNIGWINFNPTHGGVTIDQSTGEFNGYAWGENIGWISFKGGSGANAYNVLVSTTLKVLTGGVAANGQLISEGSILLGNVNQFTVEFNKDIYNPAGSSDPDDATNPANYLLFQSGTDGVYDTVDCASVPGVHADDVEIPINAVSYSNGGGSGPFVSTLSVNNGDNLPVGEYRLLVCGTTSIVDTNGIALAGDGVTSGTDLALTFSIAEEILSDNDADGASTLPSTGFAPGQTTLLPARSSQNTYAILGDLWLEIPSLGIQQDIVGVPKTIDGWDVTWLGRDIGYLDGTAFPTWAGNTVLTGHVYDENGQPGPFVDLGKLLWGRKIHIHAWGQVYTYEVRSISWWTKPDDIRAITKHEDYDWITLVTCRGYDEKTDSYKYRTVVRAVLIEVTPE